MSVLWTSAELQAATGGHASTPFSVTGVSIDTRSIAPGDLFIALVGDNGDGHDHLASALAAGAAAMVHRIPNGTPADAKLLVVGDTFTALHTLGAAARARFAGTLVAVTGSVGKTTAKEMLRCIFASFCATHAAEASLNNHWGLPLTLTRLPAATTFCVVEIGMNHAGETAPLARLARPHATLITTIGTAHIGHLGSQAAIAAEKATIQSGLTIGGLSVLPADAPYFGLLRAASGPARVLRFGNAAAADARILSLDAEPAGSTITARILDETIRFRLNVPGAHMAINAVACLLLVRGLGLDLPRAAAALAGFATLAGRGLQRRIALPGGEMLLLDESYNASTSAVRAALDVLRGLPATRRIAVLGDMLEMGAAGPAEHQSLDLSDIDHVFACGPLMGERYASLPAAQQAGQALTSDALAPAVARFLRPGDAVLVKGSLGMKMKTIVEAIDAAGVSA